MIIRKILIFLHLKKAKASFLETIKKKEKENKQELKEEKIDDVFQRREQRENERLEAKGEIEKKIANSEKKISEEIECMQEACRYCPRHFLRRIIQSLKRKKNSQLTLTFLVR